MIESWFCHRDDRGTADSGPTNALLASAAHQQGIVKQLMRCQQSGWDTFMALASGPFYSLG